MTNLITKPLVKTTHPELYAKHTYHMSKAYKLTYNYSVVDDYILQNWKDTTVKQMAVDLNEYPRRVSYRVAVLRSLGLIRSKHNLERRNLMKQYRVLMTWVETLKNTLKDVV